MKAAAPGASETAFTREELAGARRLNAVLNLLPRYHTGRRWNARTVQAVVRAIHFLVPDRLSRCDGAISRTIAAGDRQVGLRLTRPVAPAAASTSISMAALGDGQCPPR